MKPTKRRCMKCGRVLAIDKFRVSSRIVSICNKCIRHAKKINTSPFVNDWRTSNLSGKKLSMKEFVEHFT